MQHLSFDSFYLQRFAVAILPINLAAAAVVTELIVATKLFSPHPGHYPMHLLAAGCGIVMLALAGLCRYFALREALMPTVIVTVLFGAIASVLGSASAYTEGRGAVATMPVAMMMTFVGAMVALRFWHVVLSWVAILGPLLYFADLEPPVVPQQSSQLFWFCFGVVTTTSLFYWVVMRVKHGYFDLVTALDLQSRMDPLTGLYNRRAWMEEVNHRRSERPTDDSMHVLYVDADQFKEVNDIHGHEAGDRVLTHIAGAIADVFGADAIASRFGGDEFVVFIVGRDRSWIEAGVDQLQRVVGEEGRAVHRVGLSVGIARFEIEETIGDVVRRADQTLLSAKRGQRFQHLRQAMS